MNFSKLKLNESIAQGTGTSLTANAVTKTGQTAGNGKQMSNTSNNLGMQQNQMAQKQGNVKGSTVQKQGGLPQTTPQVQQQVEAYMNKLKKAKEEHKRLQESKSDWKTELTEALGLNDTAFHPYVDVMPFKSQKLDDAKKKMGRETVKQVREETIEERVAPPEERRAKKEREAEAAKAAARHARITKGVPFKDAKGTGYLKNGKKVYEETLLDEKAQSKAQQRFFGMVRAAQEGKGSFSSDVEKAADSMSKGDARKFAKTKHKGLPEKKYEKSNK